MPRLHEARHKGETSVNLKEQLSHSSIIVIVDTYNWIPSAKRNAVNRLISLGSTSMVVHASTG